MLLVETRPMVVASYYHWDCCVIWNLTYLSRILYSERGWLYVQPMNLYVFGYLFPPIPTWKTPFFSLDMVFFSISRIPSIPIRKSKSVLKKTVKCSVLIRIPPIPICKSELVIKKTVKCSVLIRMRGKKIRGRKIAMSKEKNGVFHVGIVRNRYRVQLMKLYVFRCLFQPIPKFHFFLTWWFFNLEFSFHTYKLVHYILQFFWYQLTYELVWMEYELVHYILQFF